MSDPNGRFGWYELLTTDVAAARAFYSNVVGWNAAPSETPGMDYWIFSAGKAPVAGAMSLQAARQMGISPHWLGYVLVADVDTIAAEAWAAGGKVCMAPVDIAGAGRFAVLTDPHGAAIGLWKPANPDEGQPPALERPGGVGWHELYAGDLAVAFAFYARLFGWEKKEAMDMGPLGVYQLFGTGDCTLGGMMTKPPEDPVAQWNYYFNVGNVDESAERVKAGGGQVRHGPQEVPGGAFVLNCLDPQGAGFSLLGSR
jgi:uncharacterized protein